MLIGRADHRPQAPALRTRSDAAHAHNAHCARLMCSTAARAGHAHPDQRQQQQHTRQQQQQQRVCTAPGGGAVPSPVGPSPEGTPPARLVAPSPRSFMGWVWCRFLSPHRGHFVPGTRDILSPVPGTFCPWSTIYTDIPEFTEQHSALPTKCTKATFCAIKGSAHTCTSMR